jgi:hypothetical protein
MSALCASLHDVARSGTRHAFPFDRSRLPLNGIYVLFEAGEASHGGDRIVRVGTHTGDGQLPSRLIQHFVKENKDRSIFRKNIGRALLNKTNEAFLPYWELDRTSRAARHNAEAHLAELRSAEAHVSEYIRDRFTFGVFGVEDKSSRLTLESRMISTLSLCEECQPSAHWLGRYSPKTRVCQTGLWLVNELFKTPLSEQDVERLRLAVR